MPDIHSNLPPSSSERWIKCPPSALLNVGGNTGSSYTQQGTDAHSLCEYKVKKALGYKVRDPTEDLTFFDEEMAEHTDAYCEFIMDQIADAKQNCSDPLVLVEQRLNFSRWVNESFGTADCVIVADGTMSVVDFKYGLGILIDSENNSQMRMYALGALDIFEYLYDIQKIRMIIFSHVGIISVSLKSQRTNYSPGQMKFLFLRRTLPQRVKENLRQESTVSSVR